MDTYRAGGYPASEGQIRVSRTAIPDPSAGAILEHLERVLASPSFRNSKRSQDLLQFLVAKRLAGDWAALKERVIGAELFGRHPDYDTGADAIVRVRVNELRKRLASYYAQEGRDQAVRIELTPGSYAPSFRWANANETGEAGGGEDLQQRNSIGTKAAAVRPPRPPRAAVAALVLGLGGAALWLASQSQSSPVERFWAPLLAGRQPLLVCIPARERWLFASSVAGALKEASGRESAHVQLRLRQGDIAVVAEGQMSVQNFRAILSLARWLAQRGIPADFRLVSEVSPEDIRRRAVVLVGAYHNPWAMELNQRLRYVFESQKEGSEEVCWVKDRSVQGKSPWLVPRLWPYAVQSVDFAIISRTFDPSTGRVMLSLAGVNGFGTQVAAEFLTVPDYWEEFTRKAPANWHRRNCQIVLQTKVVREVPNPPSVLAVHVW